MPLLEAEPPLLVTPPLLDQRELQLLRVQNADFHMREKIAADAYHRLRGETEQLRKQLTTERLNNGADRRRMDLLVALCQAGRSKALYDTRGVALNTGDDAVSNPENLRAYLDDALARMAGARATST